MKHASHRHPTEVIIGLNNRDPQWHDLYRVNLLTGELALWEENNTYLDYQLDDDHNLRLAYQMTPDGGIDLFRRAGDAWKPWTSIPAEDMLTTNPVGFDKTGRTLFLKDSRGRNTSAVVALDTENDAIALLAEDALADAQDVITHPTEKSVQAVSFVYERKRWQVLDPAMAADLARLRTVADGDIEIASRTLDDQYWIVVYVVDDGPARYYLYRPRGSSDVRFLFTNRQALGRAAAGADAPGRRSRRATGCRWSATTRCRPGATATATASPTRPQPMVFMPHGGPWGRDFWGYNAWHQWLANRGYAVLCVNFRASTGFGKAFDQRRRPRVGRQDDRGSDRRRAVGGRRRASPRRKGRGHGRQLRRLLDAGRPDLLPGDLRLRRRYRRSVQPDHAARVDAALLEADAGTLHHARRRPPHGGGSRAAGPPFAADLRRKIRRPLLIGQGANDPRVKQAESDQIVAAMQARQIPVTYVLYPDEGHGFARPENWLSFNAIAEAFLAEFLGGRFQPIGDDFANSSLQVLTGADDVPGLAGALAAKG